MEKMFELKIRTVSLIDDVEGRNEKFELQNGSGVNHCPGTGSYSYPSPTVHTRTGCTLKTMVCITPGSIDKTHL